MINYQAFLDYLTNLHHEVAIMAEQLFDEGNRLRGMSHKAQLSVIDEIKKELIRNHEEFIAKFEADTIKYSEYFQDRCFEAFIKQQENNNDNNT